MSEVCRSIVQKKVRGFGNFNGLVLLGRYGNILNLEAMVLTTNDRGETDGLRFRGFDFPLNQSNEHWNWIRVSKYFQYLAVHKMSMTRVNCRHPVCALKLNQGS